MKVAVDVDGTIDANPAQMRSIMSALMAAGQYVVILTGTGDGTATQTDWQNKVNYLNSLGCGECWNELVVVSHTDDDLPDIKAKWCAANGVDVLIDNDKDNAKAATASGIPLVLVPWASRI